MSVDTLGTELDRSVKVTSTAIDRFLGDEVYYDYKKKSEDDD